MRSMNTHNASKINRLLKIWSDGTVAVQPWLSKQDISRNLSQHYVKSQWLERVGKGAFIKAGDQVDWTGGIFTLQSQLNFKIHVAAKTALEIQGHTHFIPLGVGQVVWLFQSPKEKRPLPGWMVNCFGKAVKIQVKKRELFKHGEKLGMIEKDFGHYQILISSRERAIMEYLDLVPEQESFSQGIYLIEGLLTLRPKVVQTLLEDCTSIKVKRLFMHLAEKENFPWVKKLNLSKIDFGSGKRVIAEGGKFNSKYNVSVPIVKEA